MGPVVSMSESRPAKALQAPSRCVVPSAFGQPGDRESRVSGTYAAMLDGFSRSGGVLSGDQLALQMRHTCVQPISTLARWIVHRDVVSFEWRGQVLLPMFQFDAMPLAPRRGLRAVMAELSGSFDDWDVASWFAHPNAWLDGATPADALPHDEHAVLEAARADRFIARG